MHNVYYAALSKKSVLSSALKIEISGIALEYPCRFKEFFYGKVGQLNLCLFTNLLMTMVWRKIVV